MEISLVEGVISGGVILWLTKQLIEAYKAKGRSVASMISDIDARTKAQIDPRTGQPHYPYYCDARAVTDALDKNEQKLDQVIKTLEEMKVEYGRVAQWAVDKVVQSNKDYRRCVMEEENRKEQP